jgi:hypothetical protein
MENVRGSQQVKVNTPMKKLLIILCFVPMAYSCTKESVTETPAPKTMVSVEVTSNQPSLLVISAIGTDNFSGIYKKTFAPAGHTVSVKLHSDIPCTKTIKIYVNGEIVAQRSGTCEGTDYDLTYDLNQY